MASLAIRIDFGDCSGSGRQVQVSHDDKEEKPFRLMVLNEHGEELVICVTDNWRQLASLCDALQTAINTARRAKIDLIDEDD